MCTSLRQYVQRALNQVKPCVAFPQGELLHRSIVTSSVEKRIRNSRLEQVCPFDGKCYYLLFNSMIPKSSITAL